MILINHNLFKHIRYFLYVGRRKSKELGTTISYKIPISMLIELDRFVDGKTFRNRTEAITSMVSIGMFIHKQKNNLDTQDIVKKMNDVIKKEEYMDWLRQLSPTQLHGLSILIQQEMDNYNKQQNIIEYS